MKVSIVLVNFRGAEDTLTAIRHISEMNWPDANLEVVVVDNASGDGSAEKIAAAAPKVKLVASHENLGFAAGCNLGARNSSGEIIAFLNNDARPDRDWVASAVDKFAESEKIGAVASRVLDWDGKNVDFIDAGLTWFGMGYKPYVGNREPQATPHEHDVLFGTGSAMFVRRHVYEELGGFDERFFMFFEDVDFGWRLNLKGYRFVYEPSSLAFHKHHASMGKLGSYKETFLIERNALFTLYKNLGNDSLDETLAAAILLSARRAVARGNLDSNSFDIRKSDADNAAAEVLPRESIAALYAMDQFVEHLPELTVEREKIQSERTVPEHVVQRLFLDKDAPSFPGKHFREGYEKITSAFGVLDQPTSTRVLVITGDPIGKRMAGPAIRAWHMAEALAGECDVRLVSTESHDEIPSQFGLHTVKPGDDRSMRVHEEWADVIVFQGLAMSLFPSIRHSQKILVVDIYDPMHLEQLEQGRSPDREAWEKATADATSVLNAQLTRGDFFLCASERQRHFYLGQLAALGRVNPSNYAEDPDLSSLISVVPFGLEADFPNSDTRVLRGVHPSIGEHDKLLIWSGGLYDWFDPMTLIRAVAELAKNHPEVKLFFLGTKHPHPGVPEMRIVSESRELARELGVLDRNVIFNDSWVEYKDRGQYLAEANLGVSTHHSHVETTFSFRTRILDYLWASLPMVVTRGDVFAELVETRGLGRAVDSDDVSQLVVALEAMLYEPSEIASAKAALGEARADFVWDRTLQPLVDFVRSPHRARDRTGSVQTRQAAKERSRLRAARHSKRFFRAASQGGKILLTQGPKEFLHRLRLWANR